MFGAMFFVSQYMQFVLGYSALQSGAALIPVAVALMVAAPLSAKLVEFFGTKAVVTVGLVLVALALLVFSFASTTSGYGLVAAVLVLVGFGMGFAMAPATDSIMGSCPRGRASARLSTTPPRDRRRPGRHSGQHRPSTPRPSPRTRSSPRSNRRLHRPRTR
jgi:MFS family permease